ncbi:MAG: hypothetical protein WEB03_10530 [Nitriliruptor sp.]|uniref:hypothetical protein n=1 Tax=Nitriliruptor sp. TaxID=2448056 RepID=UPI0034A068FB
MGLVESFAQFGTDWWYVVAPIAFAGLVAAALVRASALPAGESGVLLRFANGAGRVTGWPDWAAATFLVAFGAMLIAFSGFFWDVAWHVSIGRDEFLLSPPHVHLLLATTGLGIAGALGVHVATRTDAPVGWQVRRWRVPFGCAGLLAMGVLAISGYWVDEFWHAIYGLDVTMWSPPHMLMIGSVMFAPIATWLVLAEAGRRPVSGGTAVPLPATTSAAGTPSWRVLQHRVMAGLSAGAVLVGLSAVQFEYDLAVSVWPQAAQVVLIALAASVGLLLTRVVLGRGGALAAVGVFVVLRVVMAVVTAGVWSLEVARFPLYLAGAIAVEIAFLVTRGRSWTTRAYVAGGAVGTAGLAGEWLWMQLWGYHPWGAGLWPEALLGTVAAVAIAPIGVAIGRVLAHRSVAINGRVAGAGALVALLAIAPTLVRDTADVSARVTSSVVSTDAAGRSLVDVTVEVTPVDAAVDADRFEVFQWQGGERTIRPLVPTGEPGAYRIEEPAPVGGERKTMVLLASGSQLGAVPIYLPADPEIGASEIAFEPVREADMVPQTDLFLREALEGAPTWPGYIAGVVIAVAIGGTIAALAAGVVGLDRRRAGSTPPPGRRDAVDAGTEARESELV